MKREVSQLSELEKGRTTKVPSYEALETAKMGPSALAAGLKHYSGGE